MPLLTRTAFHEDRSEIAHDNVELARGRRRGWGAAVDRNLPARQCPRAAAREEYAAYCVAGISDKPAPLIDFDAIRESQGMQK
jgi:hypothetical protein